MSGEANENGMRIARACADVLERGQRYVSIVLDRPVSPRMKGRGRMRLIAADRGSPLGEVACENAEGRAVCHFDAVDVLAWMHARGLISVTLGTREDPTP